MNKKEIRQKYLKLRNALSDEEIRKRSQIIQKKFLESSEFEKNVNIGIYFPIGSEVQTNLILQESNKHIKCIGYPKIFDKEIRFFKSNFEDLIYFTKGKYGIPEPVTVEQEMKVQLILIPGISFDKKGNRIGYGKGYYDRFLLRNPNVTSLGLAYDIQIHNDNIPIEEHDKKISGLITESKWYYFKNYNRYD